MHSNWAHAITIINRVIKVTARIIFIVLRICNTYIEAHSPRSTGTWIDLLVPESRSHGWMHDRPPDPNTVPHSMGMFELRLL